MAASPWAPVEKNPKTFCRVDYDVFIFDVCLRTWFGDAHGSSDLALARAPTMRINKIMLGCLIFGLGTCFVWISLPWSIETVQCRKLNQTFKSFPTFSSHINSNSKFDQEYQDALRRCSACLDQYRSRGRPTLTPMCSRPSVIIPLFSQTIQRMILNLNNLNFRGETVHRTKTI